LARELASVLRGVVSGTLLLFVDTKAFLCYTKTTVNFVIISLRKQLSFYSRSRIFGEFLDNGNKIKIWLNKIEVLKVIMQNTKQRKQKIDIFKELELEDLPLEKKKKLVAKIFRAVHIKAIERVLDFLTEEEQVELDEMRQRGRNAEEVENFLKSKVPNLEVIAEAELRALLVPCF